MRDKSLLEKDVDQYLSFLNTTTSLEKAVEGAQLVIEAVSENPQVKEKFIANWISIVPKTQRYCQQYLFTTSS